VLRRPLARVPKPLRVALINAEKQTNVSLRERNLKKCELTIIAATEVVEYLKAQKIQLPPAPKLVKTAAASRPRSARS
jgi:ribosomal protein L4